MTKEQVEERKTGLTQALTELHKHQGEITQAIQD